jgi:hypothetical protein
MQCRKFVVERFAKTPLRPFGNRQRFRRSPSISSARVYFGDGIAHPLGRAPADIKLRCDLVKADAGRFGSEQASQLQKSSGELFPHRKLVSTRAFARTRSSRSSVRAVAPNA